MSNQLSASERARLVVQELSSDFEESSSLEEFIAYAILDANKQAGAEVLAACIARLRESAKAFTNSYNAHLFGMAVKVLENLQPAASGLGELLRKAELRGILLAHKFDDTHKRCRSCRRITELDKAHTIEEKA